MDNTNIVTIADLNDHVARQVTLAGWLYNLRSSGKVLFLIVRDGTGLCQCVLEKSEENGDLFENIRRLGQESSLLVSGNVYAALLTWAILVVSLVWYGQVRGKDVQPIEPDDARRRHPEPVIDPAEQSRERRRRMGEAIVLRAWRASLMAPARRWST